MAGADRRPIAAMKQSGKGLVGVMIVLMITALMTVATI